MKMPVSRKRVYLSIFNRLVFIIYKVDDLKCILAANETATDCGGEPNKITVRLVLSVCQIKY